MSLRTLRIEANVTTQGQVTVPSAIREALHLQKPDRLAFVFEEGRVIIEKAAEGHRDQLLDGLLGLLSKDIEQHPTKLKVMSDQQRQAVQTLVKDVETGDLEAPLPDDE